jgi:type II secretory pathway pseudopilin PulG
MKRASEERGFTLIELLVSMGLSMLVIGSVVTIITVFLNDSRYDTLRDTAQNDARTLVDRVSRELRSAASSSSGASGLIERAGSYDLIFETVNPSTVYGGSNASNQYRVRYCLDGSQTLWRQTATWTTASAPAVPTSTACPDTNSADYVQSGGATCCKELTDVTNTIGGDTTRPLFTYGPTGWSSVSQIQEVQVNVITDLNPGHLPGPSPQLTSGIYLRNENSAPAASLSVTWIANGSGTRDVTLNGTSSTDPNGQSLTYQWYANSGSTGCASSTAGPATGAITGGTTVVYDAGTFNANTTETFALLVTDTQGLTSCNSQTVTIT